ncbi:hypothetical protein [Leucobacter aridicollis]|uniref:hypothetical protein n=1 Tax=Leucobacter aridicollis TaxID=283878 RepID=UPI002102166D|nr:hypothetical protein [Leucobacter aridicollis]UTX53272.1 hypothetical protein KI794_00435 [Leucobacter aridicollis]
MITRTATTGAIAYTYTIDGIEVSELVLDVDTRKVINVETLAKYQGEGFARALWDHANTEAEAFHALEHHRTPEGDAFARAVGGETIAHEDDFVAECSICTGE